jgi:hypothetical protein
MSREKAGRNSEGKRRTREARREELKGARSTSTSILRWKVRATSLTPITEEPLIYSRFKMDVRSTEKLNKNADINAIE